MEAQPQGTALLASATVVVLSRISVRSGIVSRTHVELLLTSDPGDYEDDIVSVCEANGMFFCEGDGGDDVLFECLEGPTISAFTLIRSPQYCNSGCQDGGAGNSDYCA